MANDDRFDAVPSDSTGLGGWRWFVVYAVLSLVIEWPVVGSLTTHISYGHETEITVPLLNLWTVWWNADRAGHWFWGYWDAPIFFPTKRTFLFSEAQPTSLIVAPIVWLTGNRGLAYNIYQLLILTLNGYSAHRLLRRVGHIPWLAFCGGVMSQILPFAMWQSGAIQLTTLFGIHWTLHGVLDLFQTANRLPAREDPCADQDRNEHRAEDELTRDGLRIPVGVRLGLAYGLTYWLCNYWGLFLTMLVVPSSCWLWNRQLFSSAFWRQLLWAFVIALVMIGPIALLQRSLSREHDWSSSRSPELTRNLSAHWRDYTDVPWRNLAPWLEFPEEERRHVWVLGVGGLKLLLAPIGLIAASLCRRRRRWGAFVVTFSAVAFGLSLGPAVHFVSEVPILGGVHPYELLQQYIPGLSLIRSPFRFSLFTQLGMVWLAIEALDLISPARWLARPVDESENRFYQLPRWINPLFGFQPEETVSLRCLIPLFVGSVIVALEAPPPAPHLYELPSRQGIPVWVQWLRDNAESDQAIACLPFPAGDTVTDYEEAAVWMYWSSFHRLPMVNGYSGFFPANYCDLQQALAQFQPPFEHDQNDNRLPKFAGYAADNPGLKRLNENLVRYVVVKRSFGTADDIWRNPETRHRWELVESDEAAGIDVYRISVRAE